MPKSKYFKASPFLLHDSLQNLFSYSLLKLLQTCLQLKETNLPQSLQSWPRLFLRVKKYLNGKPVSGGRTLG